MFFCFFLKTVSQDCINWKAVFMQCRPLELSSAAFPQRSDHFHYPETLIDSPHNRETHIKASANFSLIALSFVYANVSGVIPL